MAGTIKRTFGPVALTTTYTTNIYNNTSALIYDVIKRIHVVNKTGAVATFNLFLGATGANTAGTELFVSQSVAASSSFDYFCNLKMASTDFLVGGANVATALTIYGEGEQNVV